jgi:hypothetical protein
MDQYKTKVKEKGTFYGRQVYGQSAGAILPNAQQSAGTLINFSFQT